MVERVDTGRESMGVTSTGALKLELGRADEDLGLANGEAGRAGKPPPVEPKSLLMSPSDLEQRRRNLPPPPPQPLPPDYAYGVSRNQRSFPGHMDIVAMGRALSELASNALATSAVMDSLTRGLRGDFTSPIRRWALDLWDDIKDLDPDDVEAIDAAIAAKLPALPRKYLR